MFRNIFNRLVDRIYFWAHNYRNKQKLAELKKRDPFIYN
jgi:hypothetical protein